MMSTAPQILFFTDSAIQHIQSLIAQQGGPKIFRLTIKTTGCTGLMYIPQIVAAPESTDIPVSNEARIAAYVDAKWKDAITGTTVDFMAKSLGQKILHFENPNADSVCGCGESFNLKER